MTGGHRRILVVEDDPETAGQLVESLTTSGYQVDLAVNGNEALSRGVVGDYAVITIDRMLPDIDGIAVMRHLRDDGIAAPVGRQVLTPYRLMVRDSTVAGAGLD